MKFRKLSLLGLSVVLALPFAAGCGGETPGPGLQVQTTTPSPVTTTTPALTTTSPSTSLPTTTVPTTAPSQTRVVLAEMFTGDW